MKQEDKDLLLKDLSARLPYGVMCQMEDNLIINDSPIYDYKLSEKHLDLFQNHLNFYVKPYLRPMSSMTEEEYNEWFEAQHYAEMEEVENSEDYFKASIIADTVKYDWLKEHHFDYRYLIDKGLAIAVTEENNPYGKDNN